ncbi:hypothetical protein QR680_015437 [Steinernema hermaphroditum]|uniref:Ras-GAP domain-containing protein n=1 Tax=Steinernema hermaphroditum TaxID=289476 RepID=A0AA39LKU3_9BILA|nr:hypothetical protein QR680_015437 [Steinernema hermaphroditum]
MHRSYSTAQVYPVVGGRWFQSTYSLNVIPEEEGCFVPVRHRPNFDNVYDQPDEGTESLDRRYWQHKQLSRNRHHGSTHDIMATSMPPPSTNYTPEGPGVALIDEPTTPQKLANFFARPFRNANPLKRTKSVSKLDRNRCASELVRTASRPDASHNSADVENLLPLRNAASAYYGNPFERANLRSSRSHESLLSYSTTSHMIDLGSEETKLHPVHPSVLDVPNCFKVANTYYACRTPQERTRWMENLRRAMTPDRDHRVRTEQSLQIWILEAKGIPSKRKYFCEISLDQTLSGRTSSKHRQEMCFWGQYFEWSPIAPTKTICINLYREVDPKKKKEKDRYSLIGFVQIPTAQVNARHPVERWYTVTSSTDVSSNRLSSAIGGSKSSQEQPSIRVKARYQTVQVLPMVAYDDLVRFVHANYLPMCRTLEPVLGVKAKEDIATSLVRILHKPRLVKDFLCDLVMSEVDELDNEHLMFRGNSLATKAMEAYMKLVGDEYLQNTLSAFVRMVLQSDEPCEVDPTKLGSSSNATLERNRHHLTALVEGAWRRIHASKSSFPPELGEVFERLRNRLVQSGRPELADNLISSSIFLRFLCAAIMNPSLFNLVDEYPSEAATRKLTLIAKTLQTLANFTAFGGKEHYMEFMNNFVNNEWQKMAGFLKEISRSSTVPAGYSNQVFETIDMGKELSLLHSYLVEVWDSQVHEKASKKDEDLELLKGILQDLTSKKERPETVYLRQHMSNSPHSDYENGPKYRMSRSIPATSLNTADDYVTNHALLADNMAMAKAGLSVQQHRNLHRGRHSNYYGSSEYLTRSPQTYLRREYPIYDEVAPAKNSNSLSSCSNTSTDPADDDDSDSEPTHLRPPRKNNRRRPPLSALKDTPPQRVIASGALVAAPSSGYQSQNHSSSSTSSSPVESSEPRSALAIHNPMYANTSTPSTSVGLLTVGARPCYVDIGTDSCSTSECSMSNKSSLPRTNPGWSATSRPLPATPKAIVQPTLVDVTPPVNEDKLIIEKQRRQILELQRENQELRRLCKSNPAITRSESHKMISQLAVKGSTC